jgi:hypothetical protein
MGQYFQSATPINDVDYMYQAPTNLMMKVIETADNNIDNTIQKTDLLGNALTTIKHIPNDAQDVKELQNQYQSRIDDITNTISKNPADYRKQLPYVRQVTRDIQQDMTSGRIAAIEERANGYIDWNKRMQDKVNAGKLSPSRFQRAKSLALSQDKGVQYDPNTGNYNRFQPEDLPDDVNVSDIFDKYLSDVKASSYKVSGSGVNSMWRYTDENGVKTVPYSELVNIATNKALADTKLHDEIRTGVRLGEYSQPQELLTKSDGTTVSGYYDLLNGSGISQLPYEIQKSLAASARKYAFTEEEKSHKIDAENPYAMEGLKFQHQLQATKYGHDLKRADDLEDDEDNKKEQDKKFLQKLYEQQATNPTPERKQLIDNVENGDVYGLLQGSYNNTIVGDILDKGSKSLTTEDINNNWVGLQNQLTKAQTEGDKSTETYTKAELYNLQQLSNRAETSAYKDIQKNYQYTNSDIYNFSKLRSDPQYLNKVKNNFDDINDMMVSQEISDADKNALKNTPQYNDYLLWSKFDKMQSRFTDAKDKWLQQNKQSLSTQYKGIQLTGDLAGVRKGVYAYVKDNPDKIKLYNTSDGQIDRKALNKVQKDIQNGKSPSDLFGDRVSAFNDNGTSIKVKLNGKDYILRLDKTNLDGVLASGLKDHTDIPEVQQYLKDLTEPYKKSILHDISDIENGGSKEIQVNKMDLDNKKGVSYPLNVRVHKDNQGYFTATIPSADGKSELPLFKNKLSEADLAQDLNKYLTSIQSE